MTKKMKDELFSIIYIRTDAAGAGHSAGYEIHRAVIIAVLYSGLTSVEVDAKIIWQLAGHGDFLVVPDDKVDEALKGLKGG
jgi:hypothetical protein